ncbi:MAG: acetyl-CoA carboxylase biotin carboxyl carrier protein [Planctomycetota bacterium]|jgi:acetyl-CoA carboxylase biotin carboxyl carrier protein
MSTERIGELLDLMKDHELVELELEEKDFKVRLCKHNPVVQAVAAAPAIAAPAAAAAPAEAASPVEGEKVESPIVGTFYASPAPDAEAFVKVGTTVTPDTVVCIIEAMKVMNEVKAGCSGTIAEMLVQNGEPVEYGQALFVVKP